MIDVPTQEEFDSLAARVLAIEQTPPASFDATYLEQQIANLDSRVTANGALIAAIQAPSGRCLIAYAASTASSGQQLYMNQDYGRAVAALYR